MSFKFDINLSDDDYFEFNKFVNLKTAYGKKQLLSARIAVAIMFLAVIFIILVLDGLSLMFYISAPLLAVVLLVYEILFPSILVKNIKKQLNKMKSSGKMPYLPHSVIEFFEDRFVETADTQRSEILYSSIEKIGVNEGKAIYLHTDVLRAYIIPLSVFASESQYIEFFDFITAKV